MDKLIAKLLQNEIFLTVEQDTLKVKYNGNVMSEDLLKDIKENKSELLEYLKKEEGNSNYEDIISTKDPGPFELSSAQRRLWVLSQIGESSRAYNVQVSFYLNQDMDIPCFKRAIDAVIERHEILRTVFKADETGEVKQWILKREDIGFGIDYKDFREAKNKQDEVQAYINEYSRKIFDLEKGPLLRASLLQIENENYAFCFNMHHIVSDGWSMDVLTKDVFSYYTAFKENRKEDIKPLRIQYKDYSIWQLAKLQDESFQGQRSYWLNHLSGELPLLDLPSTKQRPRIKTYNGNRLLVYLDLETTAKLKKYSLDNGGSLFMGLLATWNVLIYRYTSQKDIIIGTPVAGRGHADLEDQIGCYVNALALRNKINPEESFNTFYKRLKDNTLTGYNHQMYPFDKLVEELDLQADISRSAIFDVMLMLLNTGEKVEDPDLISNEIKEEELYRIADLGYSMCNFDILINAKEIGDYLSLKLVYNTDVYDKEMIEGLINHYRQLLNVLLENPEEKIGQIDFLSKKEKHALLNTFNGTNVAYPKDKTLVDLFEQQVEMTPDNLAVIFEGTELTYWELNSRSNQLAEYLQKNYAIKADDLVGIKQERNEWMIISILGVLKAGGAYVPIDPGYPQERIDYIEKDTQCKLLIDEGELSRFKKEAKNYTRENLKSIHKGENLSHVIYTSGSTGLPKGVLIEHRNTYSFIKWSHDEFKGSDFEAVLFTTSLNFDLSVFEIFHPLTRGKELIVLKDGLSIPTELDKGKKLLINTVPSVVGSLLQQGVDFGSVSVLNMAGEPIPSNYRKELKGKVKEIRNLYGPSEDTTYSTFIRIDKDERDLIGKPISNTQVYILSEEKELQPIGIAGEICIGGDGLARGYLNQTELTNEKFINNPFKGGQLLYKTGDLGRWLPDGNIEFIGRKDDQVKVRGYRIELGEIEHALLKNEQIEKAVVLAKENKNKEKELVAYITSKTEQNASDLRSYLRVILPDYMLPAYYVQLESLPLNSNGKVYKKALPDPEGLGLASGEEYVAPRNEIEEKLVKIWEEVLQRENIGVKDSFFNLGGHSLKTIKVINLVNQQFGLKYDLIKVYVEPTIEAMASQIKTDIWFMESKNKNDYDEVKV